MSVTAVAEDLMEGILENVVEILAVSALRRGNQGIENRENKVRTVILPSESSPPVGEALPCKAEAY